MNTNENTRDDRSEDVIELGVASIETKGELPTSNEFVGHVALSGITE